MERNHLEDLDRDGGYLNGLFRRSLHGSKQGKEADSCDRGNELVFTRNAANLFTILETESFPRRILLHSVIRSGA